MNTLYYGDNLEILRRYIKDETVDLVYLDPPFNSNATYNVLFGEQDGTQAASQIKAFEDTWKWDQAAAAAYQDTVELGGQVSRAMQAFRTVLGENTMLAYLAMMAPRLVELRRVMKPTASIYLHCDPTASHYLKMLMDAIYSAFYFRNEIVWKRTSGHSDSGVYGKAHDVILYYTKGSKFTHNKQYQEYDSSYVDSHYRFVDENGRIFRTDNLTAMGLSGGGYTYEWNGVSRIWRCPIEKMQQLAEEGRIRYTRNGTAEYIRYLDEMPGMPTQDIWTDIPPINARAAERLGYPTQKPQALLERIINASSNPGDMVLDPFCGCGTAVAAAHKLERRWTGIDITFLAMTLMKNRLRDAFGDDVPFRVIGEPVSLPDAQALATSDPYQFQWWALDLVHARPVEGKKGADKGIDGRLYFHDEGAGGKTKQVILSVKAGHTNVTHLRDLRGVLDREGAQIGVLITMEEPTKPMRTEAASAGFYDSETWGTRHPRLQILTIAELLNGKGIDMPPTRGNVTFKKAERVSKDAGQNALDI
jgi:DNA modification methylase